MTGKGVAKIDFTGSIKDLHDSQKTNSISPEDVHNSSKSSIGKADVESQMTTATLEEPTLTVVTDLSVYVGETLEAQVDSFIAAHPVVMFNKSWCLFSIDAQNFLLHDMKVSLHVIEVDSHPQGKHILNYIKEKTKHRTVPVIFIKGEFLGGFEDVNQLYAKGALQEQYLHDLTQADRCEEFMKKSDLSSKPLFWFPETVNAHVVRFTGAFNSLLSVLSAATVFYYPWGAYVAYGLFFDFILRFFGGAKVSVLGNIATFLAKTKEPKPRYVCILCLSVHMVPHIICSSI